MQRRSKTIGYDSYVRCVRAGQPGSLGNLDHFEFSVISSPQAVGAPVSVTITAKDANGNVVTGWNGQLSLYSTSGPVYPVEIQLSGGQWTGNVTMYRAGFAVNLTATGAGASGISNLFSVTGGSASTGALLGTVRNSSNTLLDNATVFISDAPYGTPIDQKTTVNGSYAFNSLACMRYYIRAEFDQGASTYKSMAKQVDVRCGQVTTSYLTIPVSAASGKIPVLLVPGMMGSTWINRLIPTMPPWSPDWDSVNLSLYDSRKSVGWGNLQEELLKNHGYVPDVTLFEVPYDWRLDLDNTVDKYLKKWIDRAKARAGTTKVDIVAHSMGGLVTRAYIQSSAYANDINKFAIVGTPNHGSANAYYLYEGGDPMTADAAAENLPPIYTLVINNQVFGNLSASPLTDPLYSLHIRNYLHRYVPAAKQLLPTYDLLIPVVGDVRGLKCEENTWLNDLNSSSGLSRLGKWDSTDPDEVKTKVFMGDNRDTILNIYSGFKVCGNPLYPDGAPIGPLAQKTSDGDGTVLQTSTFLGSGVSYNPLIAGKHMELINEYKRDIVDFLVGGSGGSGAATVMKQTAAAMEGISELNITITGSEQFLVATPDNKESGIKDGSLVNTISGASIDFGGDAGSVAIENPVDGTYTVTITGTNSEDFTLALGYTSGASHITVSRHGYMHGSPVVFTFTLDSASAEKVTINHAPLLPAGLQADAADSGGLKTVLSWTANSDPGVIGYNIYSKYIDEPYLAQIGTSATSFFDTGHPWAENSSIKTRLYAVAAKKADGTESFFSDMVQNDDRDHEGLSDEQETTLGTSLTDSDSDGDGLTDGEEYTRGTNLLLVDTDEDGYSDSAEVQSGSDPLDNASIPCTYSISPTSQFFSSSGDTGSINVTASATCNWNAISNDPWIVIATGSSGTGDGTVTYSVSTNSTGAERSGTITVAGQSFTVGQAVPAGQTPAIALSPLSKDFDSVNAGSTSLQTFTISNTGTADLVVSSVNVMGGDSGMFSLNTGGANPCPNLSPTIAAGGSCTVIAKFKPSSEGLKSTILRIISSASNSQTFDVALSGTGTIQPVFDDCPEGSFGEDFINTIFYRGITGGCGNGNFCPDNPVTRGQMAVFLLTAMGEQPASACTGVFADVNADTVGETFCKFIEKFSTLGITGGCGNGSFCPNDPVTRAQMAVFMTTALHQAPAGTCNGTFGDADGLDVGETFCRYIEKFATLGITGGCGGGNYCPNDPVTRAQMAVFLTVGFLQ